MSHVLRYSRVLAEVCVGPVNGRPGNVGLIAMTRRFGGQPVTSGGAWLEFTPAEARELGAYLNRAADECEVRPGVRMRMAGVARHEPHRDDDVDRWIKSHRDRVNSGQRFDSWHVLDGLLDDYREHADTGTPLDAEVERHLIRVADESEAAVRAE